MSAVSVDSAKNTILMVLKLNKAPLLFIILIILSGTCYLSNAQDMRSDILQIKYLYDDLRFVQAVNAGRELLQEKDRVRDPGQLIFIHQYMGFSFFQLNQMDSARVYFLGLLSIDPKKELDLLTASPKIVNFFNQLKTDYKNLGNDIVYIPYPQYIFIEDKRPGAAWRSAILPGWGQYYKGQTSRAYTFGGFFSVSALTLISSALLENSYHHKYLESTNPAEIEKNYTTYNTWSQVRQISTYTTIGIWLLAFADAIWTETARIELSTPLSGNSIISVSFAYVF
jgi:hypothetical protein